MFHFPNKSISILRCKIFLSLILDNKYIRFLLVGGLNAFIYSALLLSSIYITENYYLSVAVSQGLISIIAYVNFSFMSFKQKTSYFKFLKFCLSSSGLYLISTFLVFFTEPFNISAISFTILNVLVVAPTSYILNSKFVFNK